MQAITSPRSVAGEKMKLVTVSLELAPDQGSFRNAARTEEKTKISDSQPKEKEKNVMVRYNKSYNSEEKNNVVGLCKCC